MKLSLGEWFIYKRDLDKYDSNIKYIFYFESYSPLLSSINSNFRYKELEQKIMDDTITEEELSEYVKALNDQLLNFDLPYQIRSYPRIQDSKICSRNITDYLTINEFLDKLDLVELYKSIISDIGYKLTVFGIKE